MDKKDDKPSAKGQESAFPSGLTTDLNAIRYKHQQETTQQNEPEPINTDFVKARLKSLGHEQPIDLEETDALVTRMMELKKVAENIRPYRKEVFFKQLAEAKTILNLPEKSNILYPGSDVDITVADSFGKEHVLHLDLNAESMKILADEGYQAVTGDTQEFTPENRYDLVVLWNSGVTPDSILNLVKGGGYVLANNHHGSANIVATNIEFELIGGITPVNPAEVQPPEVVSEWLDEEYYEVTREGKLSPLSQEDYEAALLDTTRNVHSQAMGKDVMFIFRKLGI